MRRELATDHTIAALADRQGGIVTRRQLAERGLGDSAIDRRIRAGRLHPLHRGVYAVGHTVLGVDGRRWAAVLSCRGFLSHASAGAAWDIRASAAARLDVTVTGGSRPPRPYVRIHVRRAIPADEVTTLRGLPITTPARMLLDLAATLPPDQLAAALDRAERLRRVDFAQLRGLLDRYAGRPGTPSLRAQLARYRGPADTRSELERLLGALVEREPIPRPQQNVVIAGRVRDFAWPARRLVVEADSYAWHRSPAALTSDRERDTELTLAGWRTLRFTYDHVVLRPGYVRDTLLAALLPSGA